MNTKTLGGLLAVIVVAGGIFAFAKSKSAPVAAPIETPVDVPKTTATLYKDGTYTASGPYNSPAGKETIDVKLTLKNNIVTDAVVTPRATNDISVKMQAAFISGFKTLVIGKNIDSIKLGAVSGSSLTPVGFNAAVEAIKAQAQS